MYDYNYYALYLAITKIYTPEQAFDAMEYGKPKSQIDPNQTADMKDLRAHGMTYRRIGELYGGISPDVVYRRIYPRRKGA